MSTGHDSTLTPVNAKEDESKTRHVASTISSNNGFSGALARTAARAGALYFSRPVRLFRPQKVSPWTTLRGLASKQGLSFSPAFVFNIFRTQGWQIFQHHFLPPMLVNTAMGTILFTSYTLSQHALSSIPTLAPHTTAVAAMSGGTAGAIHGLVGAPFDNVARYLEGGTASWRQAWAEAFRLNQPGQLSSASPSPSSSNPSSPSPGAAGSLREPTVKQVIQELKKENLWPPPTMREAREAKHWLWEWRHMAGRGWTGWRWGCAKDITGFATFFTIFDLSRRTANALSTSLTPPDYTSPNNRRPLLARAAHALTLVSGGVLGGLCYEASARPWDVARELHIANLAGPPEGRRTVPTLIVKTLREKGLRVFFRSVRLPGSSTPVKGKWYWNMVPTLARVGPWGIAFLLWEGIGGTAIG